MKYCTCVDEEDPFIIGMFLVAYKNVFENVQNYDNHDQVVYSGDIEPSARGFRATITDE